MTVAVGAAAPISGSRAPRAPTSSGRRARARSTKPAGRVSRCISCICGDACAADGEACYTRAARRWKGNADRTRSLSGTAGLLAIACRIDHRCGSATAIGRHRDRPHRRGHGGRACSTANETRRASRRRVSCACAVVRCGGLSCAHHLCGCRRISREKRRVANRLRSSS